MDDEKDREEISRLLAQLDAPTVMDAIEAQAELTSRGEAVVEPLISVLPALQPHGKLCAIEILTHLRDPRAGKPLIALLDSESETVRQWTAEALGELGVSDAVPALQRAYAAARERGTPPDDYEPAAIRLALTELAVRQPVVPPRTAQLCQTSPAGGVVWPRERLQEVIDDLAANDQVVLGFQLWRLVKDTMYWIEHPDEDWRTDWTGSWPDLVARTHERAAAAISRAPTGDDLVATISWIDRADL